VKKWKPLFQMLANLAISSACASVLLFLFVFILRPHEVWVDVERFVVFAVFGLIFWSIENYHRKKNAQTEK